MGNRVFVVDAEAAIELARCDYSSEPGVELFAPTLLRSQVLALLHSTATAPDALADGLALAQRACRLPKRLLGDAVLRQTAWKIATDQGWDETYDAEYVALTRLQGEALVAEGKSVRTRAAALVPILTVAEFVAEHPSQQ